MLSNGKKSINEPTKKTIQNVISQTTKIVGDLKSEGDFRIDGMTEGKITTSGKVVVGKTGFIKGELQGTDAYFEGNFSGKLVLSGTLTLKSSAHIEGEIIVSKLDVEPGATFSVTNIVCNTNDNVKEMNKGEESEYQNTEKTA